MKVQRPGRYRVSGVVEPALKRRRLNPEDEARRERLAFQVKVAAVDPRSSIYVGVATKRWARTGARPRPSGRKSAGCWIYEGVDSCTRFRPMIRQLGPPTARERATTRPLTTLWWRATCRVCASSTVRRISSGMADDWLLVREVGAPINSKTRAGADRYRSRKTWEVHAIRGGPCERTTSELGRRRRGQRGSVSSRLTV